MKWLRYLVPVGLGLAVFGLDWVNQTLHVLPEFGSVPAVGVLVAPLAEMYYLWQRPLHFRYPLLLSLLLLSFHALIGFNYYTHQAAVQEAAWLGDGWVNRWVDLSMGGVASLVVGVYLLRTYHKVPKRGVDLAKAVLVLLSFGLYSCAILSQGRLTQAWEQFGLSRLWLVMVILVAALAFLVLHLVEVCLMPEPQPPATWGDLIDRKSVV
jgi:hypothetical protein